MSFRQTLGYLLKTAKQFRDPDPFAMNRLAKR
jgi:hypothetical protein